MRKLFLTGFPTRSLVVVEVVEESKERPGYFHTRKPHGGTGIASEECLFDLPEEINGKSMDVDEQSALPCPFCGSHAKMETWYRSNDMHGKIECSAECEVSPVIYFGRGYRAKSIGGAIRIRNVRS